MTTTMVSPAELAELIEWANAHSMLGTSKSFLRQVAEDRISLGTVQALVRLRDASDRSKRPAVVAAPAPVVEAPAPVSPPISISPIRPGIYTVELPDGHYTFKVEIQAPDAKFAPGTTVVSYLRGRDNTSDYTGFAFIKDNGKLVLWMNYRSGHERLVAAARIFMAHPEDALESIPCARCGRPLSTPESITAGFGPECSKMGLR